VSNPFSVVENREFTFQSWCPGTNSISESEKGKLRLSCESTDAFCPLNGESEANGDFAGESSKSMD
jgi:hypothetical protein